MRETVILSVKYVMQELGCSELEAITRMQATAAKNDSHEILEALCAYKWELVA